MTCTSDRSGSASSGVINIENTPHALNISVASKMSKRFAIDQRMMRAIMACLRRRAQWHRHRGPADARDRAVLEHHLIAFERHYFAFTSMRLRLFRADGWSLASRVVHAREHAGETRLRVDQKLSGCNDLLTRLHAL